MTNENAAESNVGASVHTTDPGGPSSEPTKFALSQRSIDNMKGVNPLLVSIVMLAIRITKVDFGVSEGLRTKERQAELVAAGKSQTLNSRHLTGHAVDLFPYVNGKADYSKEPMWQVKDAMLQAASRLRIPLEWGGNWTTFKDGPHFQLPWKQFPA